VLQGAAKSHCRRTTRSCAEWLDAPPAAVSRRRPRGRRKRAHHGYYEPLLDARPRRPTPGSASRCITASDLATRRPYWTRQELDHGAPAQADSRPGDRVLADPLDALALQIPGLGRLASPSPTAGVRTVRLATRGQRPPTSRRTLADRTRRLPAGQASWPAIKAWAKLHPARVNELLWPNRASCSSARSRCRIQALARGCAGRRADAGPVDRRRSRSVRMARRSGSTRPSRCRAGRFSAGAGAGHGSAIVGAVRADYFWAGMATRRSRPDACGQPLRMWVLWPAGFAVH